MDGSVAVGEFACPELRPFGLGSDEHTVWGRSGGSEIPPGLKSFRNDKIL
jgi:hypothetical protein